MEYYNNNNKCIMLMYDVTNTDKCVLCINTEKVVILKMYYTNTFVTIVYYTLSVILMIVSFLYLEL